MQFCSKPEASDYSVCKVLDFIAGYPAAEGKLTFYPLEVQKNKFGDSRRGFGRISCLGYALAHAISIPLSPIVAAIRVVALPIIFGTFLVYNMVRDSEKKQKISKEMIVVITGLWLKECASIVTSPLWNVIGVVRAALGIIEPGCYLKAPGDSSLTIAQRNQYDKFIERHTKSYIDN